MYILCVHDIYIYIHCIYYVYIYMYIYIYSNQQKHYPAKISKIVGHCVSIFFGGFAIGSIRYFQQKNVGTTLHSPVAAEILFSRDNDRLQVWSGGSGSLWMKLAVPMDFFRLKIGHPKKGAMDWQENFLYLKPMDFEGTIFSEKPVFDVVWAGVSWYFSFKRIFEDVVKWCLKVKLACYFNFLKLKFWGYAVERSLGWFPSNLLSTQSGCRDLNLPEIQLFRSPQVQRSMDVRKICCRNQLFTSNFWGFQYPVSLFDFCLKAILGTEMNRTFNWLSGGL